MDTLASRWSDGVRAFERGEIPPSDPGAAEGWYFAENAQSHSAARRRQPGGASSGLGAAAASRLFFTWALPRALVGLAGFYAFALTLWSLTP